MTPAISSIFVVAVVCTAVPVNSSRPSRCPHGTRVDPPRLTRVPVGAKTRLGCVSLCGTRHGCVGLGAREGQGANCVLLTSNGLMSESLEAKSLRSTFFTSVNFPQGKTNSPYTPYCYFLKKTIHREALSTKQSQTTSSKPRTNECIIISRMHATFPELCNHDASSNFQQTSGILLTYSRQKSSLDYFYVYSMNKFKKRHFSYKPTFQGNHLVISSSENRIFWTGNLPYFSKSIVLSMCVHSRRPTVTTRTSAALLAIDDQKGLLFFTERSQSKKKDERRIWKVPTRGGHESRVLVSTFAIVAFAVEKSKGVIFYVQRDEERYSVYMFSYTNNTVSRVLISVDSRIMNLQAINFKQGTHLVWLRSRAAGALMLEHYASGRRRRQKVPGCVFTGLQLHGCRYYVGCKNKIVVFNIQGTKQKTITTPFSKTQTMYFKIG